MLQELLYLLEEPFYLSDCLNLKPSSTAAFTIGMKGIWVVHEQFPGYVNQYKNS